jgi:hypothetical protein
MFKENASANEFIKNANPRAKALCPVLLEPNFFIFPKNHSNVRPEAHAMLPVRPQSC